MDVLMFMVLTSIAMTVFVAELWLGGIRDRQERLRYDRER